MFCFSPDEQNVNVIAQNKVKITAICNEWKYTTKETQKIYRNEN